MDLRHLRCFVAVAEELHFDRASARVHLAPLAVSQAVRSMEHELGVVLLERTNRSVRLTPAGVMFLDEARAVLLRMDAATQMMAALRGVHVGQFRIAAAPALPSELLPRIVARLRTALPDAAVRVQPLSPHEDIEALFDAEPDLDLVFTRAAVRGSQNPCTAIRVIARESVGVALPADHPLAAHEVIAPGELTRLCLTRDEPAACDAILRPLAAAGYSGSLTPPAGRPVGVEASLRLVAGGDGVSLALQSDVVTFGSPGVVWRPLAGVSLEETVSVVWRGDRLTGARARIPRLLPKAV